MPISCLNLSGFMVVFIVRESAYMPKPSRYGRLVVAFCFRGGKVDHNSVNDNKNNSKKERDQISLSISFI